MGGEATVGIKGAGATEVALIAARPHNGGMGERKVERSCYSHRKPHPGGRGPSCARMTGRLGYTRLIGRLREAQPAATIEGGGLLFFPISISVLTVI